MPAKPKSKHVPKHADPDEYQRFLEVAKQVEASDDPKDFDKAFERVVVPKASVPKE
jgi:hypothetical protein